MIKTNEGRKEKNHLKSYLYVTLGVLLTSFSFSFFLEPFNIVTGGVSGISIIIKNLTNEYFNTAIFILFLNIVLLIVGLIFIGKEFFMKTIYGSLLFPLFTFVFSFLYKWINNLDLYSLSFSNDLPIIVIFSSIITGLGVGLAIKHGGSTGGTDALSVICKKYVHISYSLSIYIIDGIIIFLGFILGITSLTVTLYEIVFIFICGVVIDLVVFSGFNKRAIYIISDKVDKIVKILQTDFDRGVTSIRVIGEYYKKEKKMILCVLTTREYYKLREIVESIDEKAFYFAVRASEVRGEGFSYAPFDQ